jgi:acyl-coenzyme A thioesterase PaaI-like protein
MSVHSEWLQKISHYQQGLKAQGISLILPPPTLTELQMEYLEIEPGKKMIGKLPFQKRFINPVGLYQGGFLGAALDEVFGPLSYITAERPCMTLSMNVSYLKAFTEKMGHCLIEAMVLQKTKTLIFMRAEVRSPTSDLIAHAETHVTILRDDQLQKVSV